MHSTESSDAMFQAWKRVGIFDRLVIVVHGDHGSKIREHAERELSRADYVDTFSTLFAVRQPGLPAGYDRRVAAIQELLEEVVARQLAITGLTLNRTRPLCFPLRRPGQANGPAAASGLRRAVITRRKASAPVLYMA